MIAQIILEIPHNKCLIKKLILRSLIADAYGFEMLLRSENLQHLR